MSLHFSISIGTNIEGSAFIASGGALEEEIGTGLVDGEIADLIEDQDVGCDAHGVEGLAFKGVGECAGGVVGSRLTASISCSN